MKRKREKELSGLITNKGPKQALLAMAVLSNSGDRTGSCGTLSLIYIYIYIYIYIQRERERESE